MTPYGAWLREHPLPAAFVDLDALERNVDRLVAASRGVPIRIATKSVRHVGLLRRIVARAGGAVVGFMPYAAGEVELLRAHGLDGHLLGYPLAGPGDLGRIAGGVAAGGSVVAVADAPEHVEAAARAGAAAGVELPLVIDVDLSLRLGPVHLGVRRSPIRSADAAVALAQQIARTPGVRFEGVLAYEAQVAGIADRGRSGWRDPARAWVKARSRPLAERRRRAVVEALTGAGLRPRLVNGGGTGSVAFTAADRSVTEVTVGSGFLCGHLFDGYDGLPLEPALFFALPIVRSSDRGFVTAAGGGYVASGATGVDRSPVVVWPPGLAPTSLEGWGEVQTPFAGPPAPIGSPVVARPAKSGELAERFAAYALVRGGELVGEEPTYRGLGGCFP
jgi:D-serine deaminase-like pyridoxal phosphate-dependent protein